MLTVKLPSLQVQTTIESGLVCRLIIDRSTVTSSASAVCLFALQSCDYGRRIVMQPHTHSGAFRVFEMFYLGVDHKFIDS